MLYRDFQLIRDSPFAKGLRSDANGHPFIASPIHLTEKGTPYLKHSGVSLLSKPSVSLDGMNSFLFGFDESLKFRSYLDDPIELSDGAKICKAAGQICYAAFAEGKHSTNDKVDEYLTNIKSSGHGSVLEHASYSVLLWGISRSLTHEFVRHRPMSYSQISQRYVDGKVLRFVERPEYQENTDLHYSFEKRIDSASESYNFVAKTLLETQMSGDSEIMSAESKRDQRKKVNQAARSLLPNETEAPIVVSGNCRAWRHFFEQRASPHAEIEIRDAAVRIALCIMGVEPHIFSDYTFSPASDGTVVMSTPYRKV